MHGFYWFQFNEYFTFLEKPLIKYCPGFRLDNMSTRVNKS